MDALTGAGIALVTFALASMLQILRDRVAEQRTIAGEKRADARALRDAKLARMRRAFAPVLVALGGLQLAAAQYFYSETGSPDADAETILETSLDRINEARAELWLEGGVEDVARELERCFKAFQTIRREIGGRARGRVGTATADELKQAFADVDDSAAKARRFVDDHLRAVERSA